MRRRIPAHKEGHAPAATLCLIERGDHTQARRDQVTQTELLHLFHLQAMAWHASKAAALASERIKSRLFHGAGVEQGDLYFDGESETAKPR